MQDKPSDWAVQSPMCTDEILDAGQVSAAHFGLPLFHVRPLSKIFQQNLGEIVILRGFCVLAMSMCGGSGGKGAQNGDCGKSVSKASSADTPERSERTGLCSESNGARAERSQRVCQGERQRCGASFRMSIVLAERLDRVEEERRYPIPVQRAGCGHAYAVKGEPPGTVDDGAVRSGAME